MGKWRGGGGVDLEVRQATLSQDSPLVNDLTVKVKFEGIYKVSR